MSTTMNTPTNSEALPLTPCSFFRGVSDHPTAKSGTPPNNLDGEFIVVRPDGKYAMVNFRDGVAYLWRYGRTDSEFCRCDEVLAWRGCGGFDY
jgi:hypothetical protein